MSDVMKVLEEIDSRAGVQQIYLQDLKGKILKFQNVQKGDLIAILPSYESSWIAKYDYLTPGNVKGNDGIIVYDLDPIRGVTESSHEAGEETIFSNPTEDLVRIINGKKVGMGKGSSTRRFDEAREIYVGDTEVGEFLAGKGFSLDDYNKAVGLYKNPGNFTRHSDHTSLEVLGWIADGSFPKTGFEREKEHLESGCKMCNHNLETYKQIASREHPSH